MHLTDFTVILMAATTQMWTESILIRPQVDTKVLCLL
jgi:hypothetical protein